MQFLSGAWVAALGEALRAGGVTTAEGPPLVVQQVVEHPDGTRSAYAIRIDPDGVTAQPGIVDDATVTYRQSYEVAQGIASGRLDTHVEFLMGRVSVSGDTKAFVSHRGALNTVASALSGLRDRTEF